MRRITQSLGQGTRTRETDPAPTPTPTRSTNAAQSATSPPPSARPNGRTGTHAPTSRRTAAREAQLRGRLADTRPLSRDEYLAHWEAWAQQGTGENENRTKAVRKMTEWLDQNQPGERLDLSHLGLRSLPEILPASLEWLDVSHNQLVGLPDNLPASLEDLCVCDNQLTSLPKNLPASLCALHAQYNQLTSLPESLPVSLRSLHIDHNKLKGLPDNLPASLETLYVRDNQLTSLPESLPASLNMLNVRRNPLTSLPKNALASRWIRHPLSMWAYLLPKTPPDTQPQPSQNVLMQQQLSAADIEKLRTLLSNLEAMTTQQAAAPQPADLNQIMDLMKIHFADAIERQQCDKEISKLKEIHPDSAQGAQLLYNLIYMTLITLHKTSPHNIAAPKNSPSPYTSDTAMIGKMANQGLSLIPVVGPALAVLGDIAINMLDHRCQDPPVHIPFS